MILQRLANKGLYLGNLFEVAAQRNPRQSIILDHPLAIAPHLGTELSVKVCADLIAEIAAALRAKAVRPADMVAIYLSDGFDTFLISCAISRLGAVPIALSHALTGGVVTQLLARCRRPHLIGDAHTLSPELRTACCDVVEKILVVAGQATDEECLVPLPGAAGDGLYPIDPVKPMLITHTSGTTGLPKLVVHTAWTMRARYRPQAVAAHLLIRRRETAAIQVSFVHSRLVTAMAIALRRGLSILILSDRSPAECAALLSRNRPAIIEALPNSLIEWEQLITDHRRPLARLKVLSTTFDAIHPRTVRLLLRASERRNPLHVQLYGQSEVGPVAGRLTTRRGACRRDWRSVGFSFPAMTAVRVVPDDRDPRGPGFIEVRTDGRALTYLGEDARYLSQLHNGWWRTGDLGYRRGPFGQIFLADREVDHIGGVDTTLEIEDILLERLPDLLEVVIVPDQQSRPTPVVVTKDGEPISLELWRTATNDMPLLGRPIQMQLSELPRTSTKKVQRLALVRQVFGDELDGPRA